MTEELAEKQQKGRSISTSTLTRLQFVGCCVLLLAIVLYRVVSEGVSRFAYGCGADVCGPGMLLLFGVSTVVLLLGEYLEKCTRED